MINFDAERIVIQHLIECKLLDKIHDHHMSAICVNRISQISPINFAFNQAFMQARKQARKRKEKLKEF
ncbi:unnamed protein product [Chironomus riparius]|uniref:Uncharacterized protein n=1 Tax=Chironomus riparius TaxID=315576 RepID=A0A9N9RLM7_9DIPT|nr:unnamed protein product [Chironomus riparius]